MIMVKEEECVKTLIDMRDIDTWDSVMTTSEGESRCNGILCEDYPLEAFDAQDTLGIYRTVNNWGKEHNQPKEYNVSEFEYRILYYAALDFGFGVETFGDYKTLISLLKDGYFKGATLETDVKEYFENCEVDCELGGNEKC